MTTEQQNNATLSEIWAAFDRRLDEFLSALHTDPLTTGIAAHVELVAFSDDGHPMHHTELSTPRGAPFYRQMVREREQAARRQR